MRPDSQTSATLVVNALGNGLEKREIGGSGQVPVFGISDYKIEHVFRLRASTITVVCRVLARMCTI